MATATEVRNLDYLEFYTRIPDCHEPIESPLFSLEGKTWNLRFILPNGYSNSYYRASIELQNATHSEFKSFQFDFGVGLKGVMDLSLAKGTEKVKSKTTSLVFWEYPQSNLSSKLPSYYRTGNIVKFTFRFYLPSEPLLLFEFKSRKLLFILFYGY